MMAFDRSQHAALSPATLSALREVLSGSLRRGNHDQQLRDLLCTVANEAHDKGIHAEHLLVTLKEVWYSLPEAAASTGGGGPSLLQELITRCIEEYYQGRA